MRFEVGGEEISVQRLYSGTLCALVASWEANVRKTELTLVSAAVTNTIGWRDYPDDSLTRGEVSRSIVPGNVESFGPIIIRTRRQRGRAGKRTGIRERRRAVA